MDNIKYIENEISALRNQLQNHPLYQNLKDIEDVKIFMENHVFAVMGFYVIIEITTS